MSETVRQCEAIIIKGKNRFRCPAPVTQGQGDRWHCRDHDVVKLDGEEYFAKEAFEAIRNILEEDALARILPASIRADCKRLVAESDKLKQSRDADAMRFR